MRSAKHILKVISSLIQQYFLLLERLKLIIPNYIYIFFNFNEVLLAVRSACVTNRSKYSVSYNWVLVIVLFYLWIRLGLIVVMSAIVLIYRLNFWSGSVINFWIGCFWRLIAL